MRFRGKSIRRKIVVLLLVPLVSLLSIWTFASYLTIREAGHLLTVSSAMDRMNEPVAETARALQRERRLILVHLADPRRSDALARLHRQQRATDRAVDSLRDEADSGLGADLEHDAGKRLTALLGALDGLDGIRNQVEKSALSRNAAFHAYNDLVDPGFAFLTSLHVFHQADLEKEGNALVGLARAREYLAREDALMAAALAAGEVTRVDQRAFSDRIAERRLALDTNLELLPAEDREIFKSYWSGSNGRTLRTYEDAVLAAGPGGATRVIDSGRWHDATSAALKDLHELRMEAHDRYHDRISPAAKEVLLRAGAAGVLGLLAVIASLVISFRVGRGLIRDLSTLRRQANESAGVRLPSVMRRLAAGDQVDVETEAPRLDYPPDETGQVGQALSTLQRAAVEAAVKQADMRRGVSEVFVNLARRNQVLLHRQLTLLDSMERRTEDADELADLFRLDHLTTRMRRHAEGLVILSGSAPSRQWRKPVQLMDVVRAAVSEVEDYERIEVRRLARLSVDGGAVADLTHLIAELLENATVFSPPHTAVQVLGERVANGFTLEIHDRGLGMTQEALLDANLRLAETPEFELSDTDRLGLFVVSRLAQRQGVRVSLQPSPYGGTTAVVLIPGTVLSEPTGHEDDRGHRALTRGLPDEGGTGEQRPALSRPQRPLLESGSRPAAPLDGPVELEAPLEELEDDGESGVFRRRGGRGTEQPAASRSRARAVPSQHEQATEQHQQAGVADEPVRSPDDGVPPAPLPRRRLGAPVLVSDHGHRVEDVGQEPSQGDTGAADDAQEAPRPGTVAGLPRRVRQASLAPQLKSASPGDTGAPPDDAAGTSRGQERDAEQVRNRMASLQRGWQRGRRHNDSPSGDAAGDTAPGTPPEGEGR